MAALTISTTASMDARSASQAGYISGLVAGEDLAKLAVCRIHTDGKVYNASTSSKQIISSGVAANVSDYAGFTAKAVTAGQPVTLFRSSAMASYSTGMTPGGFLYISAVATKGRLNEGVVLEGDFPVAMVVSDTDIVIIR